CAPKWARPASTVSRPCPSPSPATPPVGGAAPWPARAGKASTSARPTPKRSNLTQTITAQTSITPHRHYRHSSPLHWTADFTPSPALRYPSALPTFGLGHITTTVVAPDITVAQCRLRLLALGAQLRYGLADVLDPVAAGGPLAATHHAFVLSLVHDR